MTFISKVYIYIETYTDVFVGMPLSLSLSIDGGGGKPVQFRSLFSDMNTYQEKKMSTQLQDKLKLPRKFKELFHQISLLINVAGLAHQNSF